MRSLLIRPCLMLASLLLAAGAPAVAASDDRRTVPAASLRVELGSAEADAIVDKLRALQAGLKRGDKLYFTLLAGAPASYDMADTSPQQAFLNLPLDKVWQIDRVATDNPLWRPYKLIVTPGGLGKLMWDVEVVLSGAKDDVEQIQMIYRPPHPF